MGTPGRVGHRFIGANLGLVRQTIREVIERAGNGSAYRAARVIGGGVKRQTLERLSSDPRPHVRNDTFEAIEHWAIENAPRLARAWGEACLRRPGAVIEAGYMRWCEERIDSLFVDKVGRINYDGLNPMPRVRRGEEAADLRRNDALTLLRHYLTTRARVAGTYARKWRKKGIADERIAVAFLRSLEPLIAGLDSESVELHWRELDDHEIRDVIELGLKREDWLLKRRGADTSRIQKASVGHIETENFLGSLLLSASGFDVEHNPGEAVCELVLNWDEWCAAWNDPKTFADLSEQNRRSHRAKKAPTK